MFPDYLTTIGVSALIAIARDPNGKGKWRSALLKVFREIARAFSDDADFLAVAKKELK